MSDETGQERTVGFVVDGKRYAFRTFDDATIGEAVVLTELAGSDIEDFDALSAGAKMAVLVALAMLPDNPKLTADDIRAIKVNSIEAIKEPVAADEEDGTPIPPAVPAPPSDSDGGADGNDSAEGSVSETTLVAPGVLS